jgi:hypothetical protein
MPVGHRARRRQGRQDDDRRFDKPVHDPDTQQRARRHHGRYRRRDLVHGNPRRPGLEVTSDAVFTEYTNPTPATEGNGLLFGIGREETVAGAGCTMWFTEFSANRVARVTTEPTPAQGKVVRPRPSPSRKGAPPRSRTLAASLARASVGAAPIATATRLAQSSPRERGRATGQRRRSRVDRSRPPGGARGLASTVLGWEA